MHDQHKCCSSTSCTTFESTVLTWLKYNQKVITLTVTLYNYYLVDVTVPVDTGGALTRSPDSVTSQLIFSCVKTWTEDVHVFTIERIPQSTDLHKL